MPARKTPLYDIHVQRGARVVDFAGFAMPLQYEGIVAEHQRVRSQVGLFDVSHMGEIRVRGPEAIDVVNRLITNDLRRIDNGRAQYTCLCAEDGGIVDDMIVYRLADDDVLICANASNRDADLAHILERARGDAEIRDEGDAWAQIAVQGPNAPELLRRVFGRAYSPRPFRATWVAFDGAEALLATTGYTGEKGAEIYVPNASAVAMWERLERDGEDLGVAPIGLGARDTLRLEMGYCLYGNDIDRTTSPLEAGLGWVTRLDKAEFVGRDALLAQQAAGVTRRLVGVEVFDRGIPRAGCEVRSGGRAVGAVTSGTRSPSTGRAIGLAYVEVALAEPGTELAIDIRGKQKPARITPPPFFTR